MGSLVNPYRIVNKPSFLTGRVSTAGTFRFRRLPVTGCRHDPDAVESLSKITHAPCPSGEVPGVEGGTSFVLSCLSMEYHPCPPWAMELFLGRKTGRRRAQRPRLPRCVQVYLGTGDLGPGDVDGIYLTR